MGTLGGKIGTLVGIVSSTVLAVPVLHLTPGICLFEEGCGDNESLGVAFAAVIILAASTAIGAGARVLTNFLRN